MAEAWFRKMIHDKGLSNPAAARALEISESMVRSYARAIPHRLIPHVARRMAALGWVATPKEAAVAYVADWWDQREGS